VTVFAARACSILYGLLHRGGERSFLIPANVCPIVPVTFLEARRDFELVDIAESTLEMDPDACIDRLRREAKGFGGILFVRPYGRERNVDPFFRRLKELQPDLLLIDDKCLCRPDCEGATISPWADATLFSTGRVKHVDLGYGGFAHLRQSSSPVLLDYHEAGLEQVTCRYKAIADKSASLGTREQWLDLKVPQISWEEHRRRVLEELRRADEHKHRLNTIYSKMLPREIQMTPEFQGWRFNIRVPEPGRLVESLFAAGLFASRHYASLAEEGRFPVVERLHREVVNLFNDRYFDEGQAERAVHLVLRHLGLDRSGFLRV